MARSGERLLSGVSEDCDVHGHVIYTLAPSGDASTIEAVTDVPPVSGHEKTRSNQSKIQGAFQSGEV